MKAVKPEKTATESAGKRWFYLLGLLGAVVLLWDTWLIYPLRLLVVFFHELSHGLTAIATGGEISHIEIVAQEGGVCYTRGGSRFLTLSAGYLGSLLWGGGIYYLAAATRRDRALMMALGGLVLIITVLYLRNPFGFGFALATGLVMIGAAQKLPEMVNDLALRLIGMTSMIYAPLDIIDDIIRRPNIPSDAYMLAQEIGGTAQFWGGVWLIISVGILLVFIKISIKQEVGVTPAEKKAG